MSEPNALRISEAIAPSFGGGILCIAAGGIIADKMHWSFGIPIQIVLASIGTVAAWRYLRGKWL